MTSSNVAQHAYQRASVFVPVGRREDGRVLPFAHLLVKEQVRQQVLLAGKERIPVQIGDSLGRQDVLVDVEVSAELPAVAVDDDVGAVGEDFRCSASLRPCAGNQLQRRG